MFVLQGVLSQTASPVSLEPNVPHIHLRLASAVISHPRHSPTSLVSCINSCYLLFFRLFFIELWVHTSSYNLSVSVFFVNSSGTIYYISHVAWWPHCVAAGAHATECYILKSSTNEGCALAAGGVALYKLWAWLTWIKGEGTLECLKPENKLADVGRLHCYWFSKASLWAA